MKRYRPVWDYFQWSRANQEKYRNKQANLTPFDRLFRRVLGYTQPMNRVMFPLKGEDCIEIMQGIVALQEEVRQGLRWMKLYKHQRDQARAELRRCTRALESVVDQLDQESDSLNISLTAEEVSRIRECAILGAALAYPRKEKS